MALPANSHLGPYEILDLLGVGGMGEVYRARDPRIGREVAIKTLPPRFGSDPEAIRRFEQEARAAGVLNHPNVLAVYDVGSENGTHYVVSELLEGESLKERLDRGPIPRRKAIEYALEMLRGLSAAHEKGIAHRDIKPANLFLTKDDRVKILDFGLAKLLEPAPTGDETQAMGPATSPGMVMGSLGYMSPEQVRGQTVDHRTDIFSMGVVVYEMLAGSPAFQGDSAVECMNGILKDDPPPLAAMPALDGVLRHCLEKKPELRFQSARDLAFALEAAAGDTTTSTQVRPTAAKSFEVPWRPVLAVLAVAAAIAGGYLLGHRNGPRSVPEYHRLGIYHGPMFGGIVRHRFAPDGQTIVVGNDDGVFFTRTDNPGVRSLNLKGYQLLAMSAAGELAILDSHGTVSSVPLSGGAPRALAENVVDADWGPDGKSLAVIRHVSEGFLVEYPSGHPIYRSTNSLGAVRVSPTGGSLALFEYEASKRSLVVLSSSGEKTMISRGWIAASRLAWRPDGQEIYFSATRSGYDYPIWGVTLNGVERLVERIPGRIFIEDVSRDGRVLLHYALNRVGLFYHGSDGAERDLSWLDFSTISAISADGSKILMTESGEASGKTRLVYLQDAAGGPAVRLGEGQSETLSQDGKTVAALTQQEGKVSLLPTGAGQPKTIDGPGHLHDAVEILPDGRLICWAQEPGHGSRLYLQETGGSWKALTPEFSDTRTSFQVVLSPAGDRVAARHGSDLFVYSLSTGELRAVRGWQSWQDIAGWTADGRGLYAGHALSDYIDVSRFDLDKQADEPWKRIDSKMGQPIWIRITPDGRSWAFSYTVTAHDAYVVDGVK